MGSSESFKKDPNIDIFVELGNPIYTAGSQVQGNIYLNVKKHSEYDALYLRLEGRQYVYWSQGSGKNRRSYSNDRQSYLDQFIVNSFNGSLGAGHYTFPFSFVIPNEMAGSLWISDHDFIKYTLQAYLTSFKQKNDNQSFSLTLNVVQPLKAPFGMVRKEHIAESACCGCCCGYGKTKITMSCDKNFAMTGDQIKVDAQVDASQSTSQLKNCKFILSTNYLKVSSGGSVRHRIIQTHNLYIPPNNTIKENSQENYSFVAKIPENINRGTAIGNVLQWWYSIDFISEQGCCNYSPPSCNLHIVINSRAPMVTKSPQITPPVNWNPQVYQMVFYNNMKPYIYSPVEGILVRNSGGNVVNNIQMGFNNMNADTYNNMGYNNMGQPPGYYNQDGQYFNHNTQENMKGQPFY